LPVPKISISFNQLLNMTIISLKDFILTGNFGQISLGMTKREVIEYLGEPSETIDFGAGVSELFYNGFEFFYWTDNEKIFGIQNDSIEQLFTKNTKYILNKNTNVDTSFFSFSKTLTYKNLTEYLIKENITFDRVNKGEYDEIKFLSGVTFDFENSEHMENIDFDRNNLRLNGIRFHKIE